MKYTNKVSRKFVATSWLVQWPFLTVKLSQTCCRRFTNSTSPKMPLVPFCVAAFCYRIGRYHSLMVPFPTTSAQGATGGDFLATGGVLLQTHVGFLQAGACVFQPRDQTQEGSLVVRKWVQRKKGLRGNKMCCDQFSPYGYVTIYIRIT